MRDDVFEYGHSLQDPGTRLLREAAIDDFIRTIGLAQVWRVFELIRQDRGHGSSPLAGDRTIHNDHCSTRLSTSNTGTLSPRFPTESRLSGFFST